MSALPSPSVSQGNLPCPEPVSILIAESDPCAALLLEQAFFQAGINVGTDFVDDGQEVLDYLQHKVPFERPGSPLPTLLLLDLDLPGVSGMDVLKFIRSQPELEHLAVVAFGSSRNPDEVALAYALGANAYIAKPGDANQMLEAVQDLKKFWRQNLPVGSC